MGHDRADLGLESHVQHAVSLIQDQELHPRQVGFAHLEQVVEPAGRRDDNLDTSLEGSDLRVLIGPSVAADAAGAGGAAEFHGLLHDLDGELAGGGHDEQHGAIVGHVHGTLVLRAAATLYKVMKSW